MRLTIIDAQMQRVEDYIQVATVTPETFAQVLAWANRYRHSGFRWSVTADDSAPSHGGYPWPGQYGGGDGTRH